MKTKLLLLVSCALALGFSTVSSILAQPSVPACDPNNVEYFAETGHNVCNQFLEFFNARGGAEIFGYPITEWFIENGWLVQYFQRVRMEYHPENPPAYQVQLGLLGDFFAPADRKARISSSERPKSNDRERRYFPETGHSVGFSFLKFYNEHGGLDNFGYPITEWFVENGRFVQYFQRALMEWNPNRGGIELHDLGEMWIDHHRELYERKEAVPPIRPGQSTPVASAITSLHAAASVRDAFTGSGGYQTVWVYVYDQNGEPVAGAQVTLIAHYMSGDRTFSMAPTDDVGHTQTTFEIGNPMRGQLIVIDAEVKYNGLEAQAQTSFFPWW
jgi:hypothetical protein